MHLYLRRELGMGLSGHMRVQMHENAAATARDQDGVTRDQGG